MQSCENAAVRLSAYNRKRITEMVSMKFEIGGLVCSLSTYFNKQETRTSVWAHLDRSSSNICDSKNCFEKDSQNPAETLFLEVVKLLS
jgi:hypothetical protein